MKVYLSDILQGSSFAAMGRSSARVDVDGLVCVQYVCEEIAITENVHSVLVIDKDTVWIKASRVVIHVVRYLVKVCNWRRIGVIVVFVVGLGFLLCLSVALVCFMVDVHNGYAFRRAIHSLNNIVRAPSFILQFFLFLLFEGA